MTNRPSDVHADPDPDLHACLAEIRSLDAWLRFRLPEPLRAELEVRRNAERDRLAALLLGWQDLGGRVLLHPPTRPATTDPDPAAANTPSAAPDPEPTLEASLVRGAAAQAPKELGRPHEVPPEGGPDGPAAEVTPVLDVPHPAPPDEPELPIEADPVRSASVDDLARLRDRFQPPAAPRGTVPATPVATPLPFPLERLAVPGLAGAGALLETRSAWPRLNPAVQVMLLELCAARVRADQALHGETDRHKNVFATIHRYSRDERPGVAHGLARTHSPRHGTWHADADRLSGALAATLAPTPGRTAEHALAGIAREVGALTAAGDKAQDRHADEIRRLLELAFRPPGAGGAGLRRDDPRLVRLLADHVHILEGDAFKKTRKAVRDAEDAGDDPAFPSASDRLPAGWWERHGAVTAGRRGVMIGGDPRQPQWDRVRDTFQFASLDWIGTEFRRKGIDRVRERIVAGGVDVVLVLHRWTGHDVDAILQPTSKEHGVTYIPVQQSYGITGIRLAIERFGGGAA